MILDKLATAPIDVLDTPVMVSQCSDVLISGISDLQDMTGSTRDALVSSDWIRVGPVPSLNDRYFDSRFV